MASIKNSLRKIYTALGGTSSKSKTITGLLDDISTVASSGSGGIFEIVATGNEDSKTLDKTWKEIADAFDSGRICYILDNTESGITMTYLVYGHAYNSLISEDQYLLTTGDGVYAASGQNEYPSI